MPYTNDIGILIGYGGVWRKFDFAQEAVLSDEADIGCKQSLVYTKHYFLFLNIFVFLSFYLVTYKSKYMFNHLPTVGTFLAVRSVFPDGRNGVVLNKFGTKELHFLDFNSAWGTPLTILTQEFPIVSK